MDSLGIKIWAAHACSDFDLFLNDDKLGVLGLLREKNDNMTQVMASESKKSTQLDDDQTRFTIV